MTTNEAWDAMRKEIERSANKDGSIKINYEIAVCVDFLDVRIMNEHGRLRTTIYDKPIAEPCILRYRSYHPHYI